MKQLLQSDTLLCDVSVGVTFFAIFFIAEKLQLIDEQFADIYPQNHKFESFEVKLS